MVSEKRVLTLYYHRVAELDDDYNLLAVTPDNFYQQMLFLKKNYPIERFEDNWLENEHDSVVITFDDGYKDNLLNALPILEDLNIPATIFIATGSIQKKIEMWWDELEKYLLIGNNFPDSFTLKDDVFGCTWRTSSREYRINCYQALHYMMKNCISFVQREQWFEQLSEWRKETRRVRNDFQLVNEEDCSLLSKSPLITIGAHTVSHISLGYRDIETQIEEILDSIRELERLVKKKITVFSYPFGNGTIDFNENTIDILKGAGIMKSATTDACLWDCNTNPYRIPRRIVRNWDPFVFESMIKKYWIDR